MIGSASTTGSAPSTAGAPSAARRASRRVLDTGWTLTPLVRRDGAPELGPLPVDVPGRIHAALASTDRIRQDDGRPIDHGIDDGNGIEHRIEHGIDHDATQRPHEPTAWIDASDWRYTVELDTTAEQHHDHVDLVCDGLDTLATVALDGRLVGVTANMHRRHRFSLDGELRSGRQRLTIDLASTDRHAEALRRADDPWPSSSPVARPHVRTMAGVSLAHGLGPTTGIWRPVRLHAWSLARLGDVRVDTTLVGSPGEGLGGRPSVHGAAGRVVVDVPIVASAVVAPAREVDVEVVLADTAGAVVGSHHTSVTLLGDRTVTTSAIIEAAPVLPWWPRSLGTPTRYRLTVRLLADGVELDHWSASIGFRTVELDTGSDALGSSFTIVVNGVALFARGVIWTPVEPAPAPAARAIVRRRLRQACAANVDLVRVWGGGVVESDDFYDACDELGLLVWQDLPFAGTAYPERLLRDEVRAETHDNVVRVHHHPSLVLWNGNDGCQQGHATGAWDATLHGRAWGEGFWSDDVPLVLEELDPSRPYWPGSPFSGPRLPPDADLHGTSHVWTGWGASVGSTVQGRACRFVAALGGHPPATWSATPSATGLATASARAGGPEGLVAEVVRARTARTAIEYFRSLRGHCAGTVWWHLADAAGTERLQGGALLGPDRRDGREGRRTPTWYAVRDAYADRLATLQPRGHELVLHLVNDSSQTWRATGRAERIRTDGSVGYTQPIDAVVAPRSVVRVTMDACLASPRDPSGEALVVEAGGARAWWWFADDRRSPDAAATSTHRIGAATPDALQVEPIECSDDRAVVVITSAVVVRDLAFSLARWWPDAVVDRQLVSLRPGHPERFTITGLPLDDGGSATPRTHAAAIPHAAQMAELAAIVTASLSWTA